MDALVLPLCSHHSGQNSYPERPVVFSLTTLQTQKDINSTTLPPKARSYLVMYISQKHFPFQDSNLDQVNEDPFFDLPLPNIQVHDMSKTQILDREGTNNSQTHETTENLHHSPNIRKSDRIRKTPSYLRDFHFNVTNEVNKAVQIIPYQTIYLTVTFQIYKGISVQPSQPPMNRKASSKLSKSQNGDMPWNMN